MTSGEDGLSRLWPSDVGGKTCLELIIVSLRFKYVIECGLPDGRHNREAETLQGMWGVEEYRRITVLPEPDDDAILLM